MFDRRHLVVGVAGVAGMLVAEAAAQTPAPVPQPPESPLAVAERGMMFNEVDPAPFRAGTAPVYAAWREKLGSKC